MLVLKSGIPLEMLPQEMGCGSGMTCGRWLRAWQQAGVWQKLQRVLLNQLGQAEYRFQRAVGPSSMGGGAHALVDEPLPAAEDSVRAQGRIHLVFCNRRGFTVSWFSQDHLRPFRPDKGCGILVVDSNAFLDGRHQLGHAVEAAAAGFACA